LKTLHRVMLVIIISLLSSDQSPDYMHDVSQDVRILPPTFITLRNIGDCVPGGSFPQRTALPFFSNAVQVQFSCDYYDHDHVAWAMYIFYEEWVNMYGDEDLAVKVSLNNLEIQWSKNPRTEERVYDIDGNFLESARVIGLMLSPTSIWVSIEPNISDTSLVHELVHIALRASCGNADPDHEGVEYPCWEPHHSEFITRINKILAKKYSL
jgi:hypothetical protein